MTTAAPPARAAASAPFMVYDVSEWPFVKAVAEPVYPDPVVFQAHLDCFSELLHRGEKFVMMFDLDAGKMPSMDLLKQLAAFMQDHRPQIEANLVASAVVTRSMVVHGALKILFTLKKPVKPNSSFNTQAEAKAWLGKQWMKAVEAAQQKQ
jgi:hypothetical protein